MNSEDLEQTGIKIMGLTLLEFTTLINHISEKFNIEPSISPEGLFELIELSDLGDLEDLKNKK
jgi:hypothetical protein